MIKKVTDFNCLSGVSSPLLPLFYSSFTFPKSEQEGVFVQTDSADNITAFLSVENKAAFLIRVGEPDESELSSFMGFCRLKTITSDSSLNSICKNINEYTLMKFNGRACENCNCGALTENSTVADYKNLYDLLFRSYGDFDNWYCNFSKKINNNSGYGVCYLVNERAVSAVAVPYVFRDYAVIGGVYTLPNERKKGYSTRCIEGVISILFSKSVTEIFLWCESHNMLFYNKVGFEAQGKIYVGECK